MYQKYFIAIALTVALTSCSSTPKEAADTNSKSETTASNPAKDTKAKETYEVVPEPKTSESKISPEVQKELSKVADLAKGKPVADSEMKVELKPGNAKHGEKSAAGHSDETPGVPADKALGWLKNGNRRFVKSLLRADGQSSKDIKRLAKGQKPHSILVSCSDSRVPPEIVFDQKLGEIFVVRTAGQAVDHNMIASVEYAIEHLGSKLVVVMGHTACGAIKATIGTPAGADAGSPSLSHLVEDIRPRIKDVADMNHAPAFEKESWANADGVAADLINKSSIIKKSVGSGKVKVTIAVYNVETGKVEFAE